MSRFSAAPVRRSFLEGTWYPADQAAWRAEVPLLFETAASPGSDPVNLSGREPGSTLPASSVRALIVPHAGVQYSGNTAARAYGQVAGPEPRPVVVFGPSHYHRFEGASTQPAAAYETPFGRLESARDLAAELTGSGVLTEEAAAHNREHSVDVQLPFLRALLPRCRVLPVVLGQLDERRLAELADALVQTCPESTLFVASTDFTHYGERFGYYPDGEGTPRDIVATVDRESFDRLEARDREGLLAHRARTGTTICGMNALQLLLEVTRRRDLDGRLLDYRTSGDLTGDWSNSVSYGALAFHDGAGLSDEERERVRELACRTVVASTRGLESEGGEAGASLSLAADRGAFVTLRCRGKLRGCMGHLGGRPDLCATIAQAASLAGQSDPRFPPLQPADLSELELEVTVLTRPVRIDDPLDIEPGKHGVVLEVDGRQGTFLPQVATEHGLDAAGLWSALCRKIGVDDQRWRSSEARYFRYQGEIVGPFPVLSSAS